MRLSIVDWSQFTISISVSMLELILVHVIGFGANFRKLKEDYFIDNRGPFLR